MPPIKPKRLADLTPETWYYVRCRYTGAGMFLPHGCGGPILYLTDSDIPNCVYPIPSNQTQPMQTEPLVNSQSGIACHAEAACGGGWVNIQISLDPGATLPTRAHTTDVGYDVTSISLSAVLNSGARVIIDNIDQLPDLACASFHDDNYAISYYIVDTGIHVRPAPGYYCELIPNSRQAKTTVRWNNSIGIIDPEYTGSIKIIIKNAMYKDLEKYLPGNVVGQLILRPHLSCTFQQVDNLPETDRGTGGFGSTANNHSTPTT